jgi:hypothetical protein
VKRKWDRFLQQKQRIINGNGAGLALLPNRLNSNANVSQATLERKTAKLPEGRKIPRGLLAELDFNRHTLQLSDSNMTALAMPSSAISTLSQIQPRDKQRPEGNANGHHLLPPMLFYSQNAADWEDMNIGGPDLNRSPLARYDQDDDDTDIQTANSRDADDDDKTVSYGTKLNPN